LVDDAKNGSVTGATIIIPSEKLPEPPQTSSLPKYAYGEDFHLVIPGKKLTTF